MPRLGNSGARRRRAQRGRRGRDARRDAARETSAERARTSRDTRCEQGGLREREDVTQASMSEVERGATIKMKEGSEDRGEGRGMHSSGVQGEAVDEVGKRDESEDLEEHVVGQRDLGRKRIL